MGVELIVPGDTEAAPVAVGHPVPVLLGPTDREAHAELVVVRELVVLAEEQAERVGVLDSVEDADMDPLVVEDLDGVVEDVVLCVDVVDMDGDAEGDSAAVAVGNSVTDGGADPETLSVGLAAEDAEGLALSLKERVAALEREPDSVGLDRPENVRVVLTVIVTPVGKVLCDTVGVTIVVPVIVLLYLGLTEFEIEAEPEMVGVFETVVEAERVDVVRPEAVAPIDWLKVGVPDWVLEAAEELVKVTEAVDVFEDEVEPVPVGELVVDLDVLEEAV